MDYYKGAYVMRVYDETKESPTNLEMLYGTHPKQCFTQHNEG